MKKILSFALVLVLALSVLAGCGAKGPTVEDAVTYLENTYKTVQNAEDKAENGGNDFLRFAHKITPFLF